MVKDNTLELTEHEAELYDRQIRLWGLESQKRLRGSKILICGLNGLGAEVAKNIILSGVNSVTFLDEQNVTEVDSCSQFLAPVDAIGKNRAEASLARAKALNPMVEITADTDSLEQKHSSYFKQFDVVIVIGACAKLLSKINQYCRQNNVNFFASDVWGMFGYSFADLQYHDFVEDISKHKIISKPNEKIKTELITTTTKRHLDFHPIDTIFEFDYQSKAYIKKMEKCGPSFVMMRILQEFRDTFDRDPCYTKREGDTQLLIEIRNEIAEDLVEDSAFTHVFAQISPAVAIVGGELAQEIIKAVSKKEAPHHNIFLFDPDTCCGFIESIDSNENLMFD